MAPDSNAARAPGQDSATQDVKWYGLSPMEVASRLQVDPAQGLSAAEAQARLQRYGANALAEAKKEPAWLRFFKQYKE
jgi:Ca2+-transporting ATPase